MTWIFRQLIGYVCEFINASSALGMKNGYYSVTMACTVLQCHFKAWKKKAAVLVSRCTAFWSKNQGIGGYFHPLKKFFFKHTHHRCWITYKIMTNVILCWRNAGGPMFSKSRNTAPLCLGACLWREIVKQVLIYVGEDSLSPESLTKTSSFVALPCSQFFKSAGSSEDGRRGRR